MLSSRLHPGCKFTDQAVSAAPFPLGARLFCKNAKGKHTWYVSDLAFLDSGRAQKRSTTTSTLYQGVPGGLATRALLPTPHPTPVSCVLSPVGSCSRRLWTSVQLMYCANLCLCNCKRWTAAAGYGTYSTAVQWYVVACRVCCEKRERVIARWTS